MKALYSVLLSCWCFNIMASNEFAGQLQNLNYNSSNRPFKDSSPVKITLQIFIHSIRLLDEYDFKLDAVVYLRLWWEDPRLTNISSTQYVGSHLHNSIWKPDVFSFFNDAEVKIHERSQRIIIEPDGQVSFSTRLTLSILCDVNLMFYPMDKQLCSVVIDNYAAMSDYELFWHENKIIQRRNLILNGFDLIKITTNAPTNDKLKENKTLRDEDLRFSLHTKRSIVHHIHSTYIPSIMITIFTVSSFWIHDTSTEMRMLLIICSFMSSIYLQRDASKEVRKAGFTTSSQIFLLANHVVVIIALVEYLLVVRLKSKKKFGKNGQNAIILENHVMSKNVENVNNAQKVPSLTPTSMQSMRIKDEVHWMDKLFRVIGLLGYFIFCCAFFLYFNN